MGTATRVAHLYAVPSSIIPEKNSLVSAPVNIPSGLLPCIVLQCDSREALAEKLAELMHWYRANMEPVDDWLPGTAALPALSLDARMWAEAIDILERSLSPFGKATGPCFVPAAGVTVDSRFAVADFYTKLLHGSTLTPVVTFALPEPEVDIYAHIMPVEHWSPKD